MESGLISANTSSSREIFDLWFGGVVAQHGKARTKVLEYGLYLGVLTQPSILSLNQLENICSDSPQEVHRLELLYRARRFDYFEAEESRFKALLELLLDSNSSLVYRPRRRQKKAVSLLESMSYVIDVTQYAYAFHNARPIPLSSLMESHPYLPREVYVDNSINEYVDSNYPKFDDAKKCQELLELVRQVRELDADLWATNLHPWNDLVETIRRLWGEKWICFHLANVASGIRSSTETYTDYSDLLDHSKKLCSRVRYARLRAGQYAWWSKQLENSESEIDKSISILVFITWGSSKTLVKGISKLDELIRDLSDAMWANVYNSSEEAIKLTKSLHQAISLDSLKMNESLDPTHVPPSGLSHSE